jgi:hypothetical protein
VTGAISEPDEPDVRWRDRDAWSGDTMFGGGGPGGGQDPVEAGVQAAAERLARYGVEMPVGEISDSIAAATDLLRQQPEPVADRAVEFWVETVAVAASARVLYNESPLEYEELRSFLDFWTRIINSYRHPPP